MILCKTNAQECAVEDRTVKSEVVLPESLIRWVEAFQEYGGADLANLVVRLLQMWGFVGGQILWMASPLLGVQRIGLIAQALEDPQALEALKTRITKGADG